MQTEAIVNIAIIVVICSFSGLIAGIVTRGKGYGIIKNTIAGGIGYVVAHFLILPPLALELEPGIAGNVTTALAGSILVVAGMGIFSMLYRAPPPVVQREFYYRR